MKHRTKLSANEDQARGLLADIESSPDTLLPRREPIVEWLRAFLARAGQTDFVLGETEADDLVELNRFLRSYDVPVTARDAA